MKTVFAILLILLIIILVTIVFYSTAAFIEYDLNPAKWSKDSRCVVAVFFAVTSLVMIGLCIFSIDNH